MVLLSFNHYARILNISFLRLTELTTQRRGMALCLVYDYGKIHQYGFLQKKKKAPSSRSSQYSKFLNYFFLASICFWYLLMNLSTRPAVSTSFIFPV